jgi:hypothetical protein
MIIQNHIYQIMVDKNHKMVDNTFMLEALLGNRSAEKVLLHIYHYGEIHPAAIAKDYKIALNPVRQQLERFERGGFLVAKQIGRARVFSFNPKNPFVPHLKSILKIVYESIPLKEREKIFGERRRPRTKGKPIL